MAWNQFPVLRIELHVRNVYHTAQQYFTKFYVAIPMMASQIQKSVNFTKAQKSRYLQNKKLFLLQMKKFIMTHQGLLYDKKEFLEVVTLNFEHISHFILLLLLLNSNKQMLLGPKKLQFLTINLFSVPVGNMFSYGLGIFVGLHVFILIHPT